MIKTILFQFCYLLSFVFGIAATHSFWPARFFFVFFSSFFFFSYFYVLRGCIFYRHPPKCWPSLSMLAAVPDRDRTSFLRCHFIIFKIFGQVAEGVIYIHSVLFSWRCFFCWFIIQDFRQLPLLCPFGHLIDYSCGTGIRVIFFPCTSSHLVCTIVVSIGCCKNCVMARIKSS